MKRSDTIERFAELIDLDSPPLFLDGGDPRMRPAVAVAAALRNATVIAAPAPLSASARAAMRERLVEAASAAPVPTQEPGLAARVADALEAGERRATDAGRRLGRRVTTLVGSVVLVTSVAGVGVATARALPGSPFYDLKRAVESVQLWATTGEAAKGQRHLEFARTRLAEAAKLPASSPYLASTLKAMNEQTRDGNSDLLQAYRTSGSSQPLATLATFARKQYAGLARLGESLPHSLAHQAAYSALLLTGLREEVQSVSHPTCPMCQPGGLGVAAGTPAPTPPASSAPATGPGARPSPASHPSPASSGHPRTTTSPGGAPTHLLPTIPPLLKHGQGRPLPKLSPLPLLSSLANRLS